MASEDIETMSDRDHCRERTGTYLGSTDDPQVAVREIIDNGCDEITNGAANSLHVYTKELKNWEDKWHSPDFNNDKVIYEKLHQYVIGDTGRGIPIKKTYDLTGEEVTMTELAMGSLRAGSKFNKDSSMTGFSGMNGLGESCSNFTGLYYAKYSKLELQEVELSTEFVKQKFKEYGLDVKSSKRNGSAERLEYGRWYYKVEFHTGIKVGEDLVLLDNEQVAKDFPELLNVLPSTFTNYIPDPTIWRSTKCTIPMNTKYLKYTCKEDGRDIHFYVNGVENTDIAQSYDFKTKVHIENPEKNTKNDFMDWYISIGISEILDDVERDLSVNNLSVQQGIHEKIFGLAWKKAFESVFGAVVDAKGRDHSWMGVNVLCILKCTEVDFASQTKERLSNIPGFSVYQEYPQLVRALQKIIKDNYELFNQNYQRIAEYLKSKDNWSRLSQIKSMLQIASDQGSRTGASAFKPKGLKDATCKDRRKCELYIVEGKSALGSLMKARAGKDNIALLGLRGRPLNVSGRDITEVLENNEMFDFINAVGCGVNDYHSTEKVRYGKVVIATDADSDGYAIAALILGCILDHMTFLIDEGMVFIALAPLYEQNKTFYWYGDEDKIDWSKPVQRYKGLVA